MLLGWPLGMKVRDWVHKSYQIYGIEGYQNIVDEVIECFKLEHIHLDVQMILTEAMNNAFQHGNKGDRTKLIEVSVSTDVFEGQSAIRVDVTDQGMGFKLTEGDIKLHNDDLLEEDGRGMFLITYYSSKVVVNKNVVTIYKTL